MTHTLVPVEQQVTIPGVELTATELKITDPDLSFESWEQILGSIRRFHSAAKFWLGDALRFGEQVYGEKYAQASALTGFTEGHLANVVSVCGKVPSSRRRENLSFGHHEVVARLEPSEQIEWLEAAEVNVWAVQEFRSRVRDAAPVAPRSQTQFSGQQALTAGEPLTLEQVEEKETQARKVIARTLPAGHPLWETQAKALAQDVIELAAVAKPSVRGVRERLIEEAELVEGESEPDEHGNRLVGLVLNEPVYVIPRAAFDEVVQTLAQLEGGEE